MLQHFTIGLWWLCPMRFTTIVPFFVGVRRMGRNQLYPFYPAALKHEAGINFFCFSCFELVVKDFMGLAVFAKTIIRRFVFCYSRRMNRKYFLRIFSWSIVFQ
jgi:hypothetical protein